MASRRVPAVISAMLVTCRTGRSLLTRWNAGRRADQRGVVTNGGDGNHDGHPTLRRRPTTIRYARR